MKRVLVFFAALIFATVTFAAPFVNTTGSDDNTAISGFDTVAFFTEKKTIAGKPDFQFNYLGAKWLFSSQDNLNLFQKNPEKYMPEWGGQCAWAISENTLSNKKLSGSFEFIKGKLYLFSFGNTSADGAIDDFLYGRTKPGVRIPEGDKNWPEIKRQLEEGTLVQRNSRNYRKTPWG